MRRLIFYLIFSFLLSVLFIMTLSVGAVHIPFKDVCAAIAGEEVKDTFRYIVTQSRLPFAITASLSGASLSCAGLILQTTFRNPLAGPSLLGVSSGASLGVALLSLPVAGIVSNSLAGMALPITGAILGAAIIIGLLAIFSGIVRSGLSLLIVGIMISYLCSALISLLNFFAPAMDVKQFAVWGMGSYSAVSLDSIPTFAISVILLLGITVILSKPLDALLLGERYAGSMGYSVKRMRTILLIVSGLLTAITTAYCGPIGFIGLIVPHISRIFLENSSHGVLLPATILMGATISVFCALITVLPVGWGVLPINAITPVIGVPVILYLLLNSRKMFS